jgi:hypothetical protein
MADVLNEAAMDLLAQYIIGKQQVVLDLQLVLFVNDVVIANDTAFDELVECSAPGYARFLLAPGNWQGSTVNGLATYTYPQLTFAINGPGNPAQVVYGHVVYDATTDQILWGANWNPPWAIPPVVTQNPSLTPMWQDQQCP